MKPKIGLAIACLVGGVVLAAYSLAERQLLLALVGFALIFAFIYVLVEHMAKAAEPKHEITPAPDAAWKMKDTPADAAARRDGANQ